MVVKTVDELGEEGGKSAFAESLHAVFGENQYDSHASSGFGHLVVEVSDGVERVSCRVVAVADQVNGLVDDEHGSGIVEKIFHDRGLGHVFGAEDRAGNLSSKFCHGASRPGADVNCSGMLLRPHSGVKALSASGGSEDHGELGESRRSVEETIDFVFDGCSDYLSEFRAVRSCHLFSPPLWLVL